MEPVNQSSSDPAEAAHVDAMRAAEGAGVPLDWNAALDHVQRAAERGHRLAQSELAALAGEWTQASDIAAGASLPPAAWENFRRAIDLAAWLKSPPRQIISANPRIAVVDGFASLEMCDWLVARARPRLAAAKVYDHDTGGPRDESVRTNSECHFLRDDSDLILLALRARMAAVTELPVERMEATAVLHYTVGQEFLPHYDFLDVSKPGYAMEVARAGQRVLTFLLCLSDGYEGGETEFPALGKRWMGHKGNALFFWNVEPNGRPDRRTVHAGLPPTQGEKWLLSQWIRSPAT